MFSPKSELIGHAEIPPEDERYSTESPINSDAT